jgi:hypothetical protein
MNDPFVRVDLRLYRQLLPQRLLQQFRKLAPAFPLAASVKIDCFWLNRYCVSPRTFRIAATVSIPVSFADAIALPPQAYSHCPVVTPPLLSFPPFSSEPQLFLPKKTSTPTRLKPNSGRASARPSFEPASCRNPL